MHVLGATGVTRPKAEGQVPPYVTANICRRNRQVCLWRCLSRGFGRKLSRTPAAAPAAAGLPRRLQLHAHVPAIARAASRGAKHA